MLTLLHVAFGTLALIAVPASLLVRKGGSWHRRFGAVFTASMCVVLFSAGFLWQAKGHLFLVPLSGVTAYLLFNAWRVIARKRRKRPDDIDDRVDVFAAIAVMIVGAYTAYLGFSARGELLHSIQPALIGIGSIAICFGLNDILGFYTVRLRDGWKLAHLSAMMAAYISAVTAFLVINAHGVPMMLRWGVPSALGALTIAIYSLGVLKFKIPLRPVAAATAEKVATP